MHVVQILGTGCPKCQKLEESAKAAVKQLGLECEVLKVNDINAIMRMGVMMTPGDRRQSCAFWKSTFS